MEYFLSSGTTTGVEPINTITMQPTESIISTTHIISPLWDIINQLIPIELLSFISLPVLGIVFIRVLIIIWVLKDSNYRSNSTFFCLLSLLLVTIGTPIFWLPIYLAIRPLGYKHERKYWELISQNIEQDNGITINQEEFIEQIDDEQHLADLRKQANLATKRTKKTIIKKAIKKPIIKKVTTPKTPSKKIPTAKRAITRTAQK